MAKPRAAITAEKIERLIDRTSEAKTKRTALQIRNKLEYDIVYQALVMLKDVVMAGAAKKRKA